jgi:hypothetical protein
LEGLYTLEGPEATKEARVTNLKTISDGGLFQFVFQTTLVVLDPFFNGDAAPFRLAVAGSNANFSPQGFKGQRALTQSGRDGRGLHVAANANLFKAVDQFFLGAQDR